MLRSCTLVMVLGTLVACASSESAEPDASAGEGGGSQGGGASQTGGEAGVGGGVASVPAACPAMEGLEVGAPWPMGGYCPARTNRGPVRGPTKRPTLAWSTDLVAELDARSASGVAVSADGSIYVSVLMGGSDPVRVIELTPMGGVAWSVPVGELTYYRNTALRTPAIASDGTIAAADIDRVVHLSSEGAAVSQVATPADVHFASPALAPDGTLLLTAVGEGTTEVAAVTTSGVSWTREIPYESPAAGLRDVAVAADGAVHVARWGGLTTLGPDGSVLWEWTSETPEAEPLAPPFVGSDGTVHVALVDYDQGPQLHALSPSGVLQWTRTLPYVIDAASSWIVQPDGTLVGGVQWALDAGLHTTVAMTADGTISWTSDEVGALIADVDGNLYGCAPDGTGSTITVGEVVALRPTGEVLWRFPFERLSHGCSAMAITADGQLIVSLGEDGMVLALSE